MSDELQAVVPRVRHEALADVIHDESGGVPELPWSCARSSEHLDPVVIVPLRLQNNNQIPSQIRDVELASVVSHEPGQKML